MEVKTRFELEMSNGQSQSNGAIALTRMRPCSYMLPAGRRQISIHFFSIVHRNLPSSSTASLASSIEIDSIPLRAAPSSRLAYSPTSHPYASPSRYRTRPQTPHQHTAAESSASRYTP
jgi:hypothetical protein